MIPADGSYEWKIDEQGQKFPTLIYPANKRLFAFAGLWDQWVSTDGEVLRTCTIITRAAGAFMQEIHHREPVILNVEHEQTWLNSDETDVAKATVDD